MLLKPRYDDPAFLRLEVPSGDTRVPLLRQRRRLASLAEGFDKRQWTAPSRCEEWSVQDVIAHLVTTDQFWALSFASGRRGEPTRVLATLDPVATPEELVDRVRSLPWAKVLRRFVATTEDIAEAVADLDDDEWAAMSEAPPGHVPLRAAALHALWDGWIHERDIVLPLGLAPVEEPDEIAGCLAYVVALSPALAIARGSTRRGTIVVEATDPDVRFVVDVGENVVVHEGEAPTDALHLAGPAVELVEGLSFRAPLPCPVADEHRWLVHGLAEVFDRE